MKIILATDPLFWPLTGIGKYTLELAKRLSREPRITDIRFFNLGNWQDAASVRGFGNERYGEPSNKSTFQQAIESLRKALANNKSAVRAYSRITPYLYKKRLKPFASEYIYHSPNFMLPPFDGKMVATFHDLSVIKFPEFHPETRVSFLHPEICKAAERADHIITDSEAVRKEIIEYFARSPEKVSAVPLASSLGNTAPDPSLLDQFLKKHGLASRQFFLFVSSIEPRKNIDRLLDAYESQPLAFKRQFPLVLTGSSGWRSETILKRIDALSQSGAVRYLGYTSDEELKFLYCSAGALVFASLYEGFGLPIIEAQSLGTPVITSDLSCMPEVAGDAALLVDPYDVDRLGSALQQVMLDDDLRTNLQAKGIENAAKYSWDTTVSKTLDVYSQL
jgi:alpha-1,3-rhamnosyl/mannosyltransferase